MLTKWWRRTFYSLTNWIIARPRINFLTNSRIFVWYKVIAHITRSQQSIIKLVKCLTSIVKTITEVIGWSTRYWRTNRTWSTPTVDSRAVARFSLLKIKAYKTRRNDLVIVLKWFCLWPCFVKSIYKTRRLTITRDCNACWWLTCPLTFILACSRCIWLWWVASCAMR